MSASLRSRSVPPSHTSQGVLGCLFLVVLWWLQTAAAQELSLLVDSQNPASPGLGWLLRMAPNGDLYTERDRGIAKIVGAGQVEQIYTITSPGSFVRVSDPDILEPQTRVYLDEPTDFGVDEAGNLYVVSFYSSNVVRFSPEGVVTELLATSDDGVDNLPWRPNDLLLDHDGNLFVTGNSPPKVLKIDTAGQVSLVFESSQTSPLLRFGPLALDAANNKYLPTATGIYRIAASGEVSLFLDYAELSTPREWAMVGEQVDAFGNIYLRNAKYSQTLYRYSTQRGLQQVLSSEGDGTGELICAKEGTNEHDPIVCKGYGNYLYGLFGIHIDAAQNVFVVGSRSKNVFKITPGNVVSEVADFSALSNFKFERLNDFAIDSAGNFYLKNSKESGGGVSILSYSPLPVESINDFTISAPHALLVHTANGVASIPENYTSTTFTQDDALPDVLAHMDTRTPAFSALPWQNGVTTTVGSFLSDSETIRTTLNHEGRLHVSEIVLRRDTETAQKIVESHTLLVDGVQRYRVSGLQVPLKTYAANSGQALMSWLYLGNDVIEGGPRADILFAYEGHDVLYGRGGDDLLDGSSGANIYYGGDGTDVAVYEKDRDDYMLSRNPLNGFVSVQVKAGWGSSYIDQLAPDVERLRFRDGEVNAAGIRYWGELSAPEMLEPDTAGNTVYRLFNTRDNAFFYTTDPSERTLIVRNSGPNNLKQADWPYVYQGAKFQAAHSYPGSVPLFRFFNTQTGHHFFTISETERDLVLQQIASGAWPFVFEGIAFQVYASDPNPDMEGSERPVHRFYSHSLNRHVFTTSESETQFFKASSDWGYEGIGFFAESLK